MKKTASSEYFKYVAKAFCVVLFFIMLSGIDAMPQEPGSLKWAVEFQGIVYSSPAIGSDGTLYLVHYSQLYAINPDGSIKWSFPIYGASYSPAIGADGTIYAGSQNKNLYAIKPDGTLKWEFLADGLIYSSPALGKDDTAYFTTLYGGKLYAVNSDGTLKWSLETGDDIYTSPTIAADGTVYLATEQSNLHAVSSDGTRKWVKKFGNGLKYCTPSIDADGTVYIGALKPGYPMASGTLYAVNPDGTIKWFFETDYIQGSSPAIAADGTIYFGSYYGGNLYALHPDGTLKWYFHTGHYIASSPAIGADGTVYFGSYDRRLYAVNPDGTLKWRFDTGDRIYASPTIGLDGTVYFGSNDRTLYALHSDSFGLADSPWPMYRHDYRRTGFAGSFGDGIFAILPIAGGDTGSISVKLFGKGFFEGSIVKLTRSGETDIIGSPVIVGNNNNVIETIFDLTTKALGPWDVIVINPDGTIISLPDGFMIESGRNGQLWVDIIGRNLIRPNQEQKYWISYGNKGNVAEWGGVIFLEIPAGIEYKLGSMDNFSVASADVVETIMFSMLNAGEIKYIPLGLRAPSLGTFQLRTDIAPSISRYLNWINKYEPYSEASVLIDEPPMVDQFDINADSAIASINAKCTVIVGPGERGGPGYVHYFELTQPGKPLEHHIGIELNDGRIGWSFPGIGVEDAEFIFSGEHHGYHVQHMFGFRPLREEEMAVLVSELQGRFDEWEQNNVGYCNPTKMELKCLSCLGLVLRMLFPGNYPDPPSWPNDQLGAHELLPKSEQECPRPPCFNQWDLITYIFKHNRCDDVELVGPFKEIDFPSFVGRHILTVIGAIDPNDKFGSNGVGEKQYLSGDEPLRYSILFENLPTATAPAQQVVITDQLDTTNMDLTTLRLGPITFGETTVMPSQKFGLYTSEIDLRPEKNLIVEIEAILDNVSGVMTWRLTSIDPQTGEPPEDPLAGFLPPNITPPEGEGSVLFSLLPKKSVATDTEIRNRASIVFDTNDPIDTAEWFNTVDNTEPTSYVLDLDPVQINKDFEVQWTSTDVGSGIKSYTIMVSTVNGPYAQWLIDTTDISAVFSGEEGRTYAFYSIARDKAGNIEGVSATPDAITTIRTPCESDHEPDSDVDGGDLMVLINTGGMDIHIFADDFGRVGCP